MGRAKDLQVETEPTEGALGTGTLRFDDTYSVFDWGEMPDEIPGKGASRCAMGADTFERLGEAGVKTHYRGVIENGETMPLSAVSEPPTEMAIDVARVPELPHGADGYDYEAYHAAGKAAYVIPLEIVYRNAVPQGASLRDRVDPGAVGLEADIWPAETVPLPDPVLEFSTRLEKQDRYLDEPAADRIAGPADIGVLADCAREVNRVVTERADRVGLTHLDGRIECLYHDGTVKVADVTGTFDENRFSRDGVTLSKDVIGRYYRENDPEWVEAVTDAKRDALASSAPDWREAVEIGPKPLPEHVLRHVSNMYKAGANTYLGRDLLSAPPLESVLEHLRQI